MVAEVLPDTVDFGFTAPSGAGMDRLRETAGDAKRWQSLLAAAADQREFAEDGAREGFADALAGNTELLTRT
jgi:hypothetical protein